MKKIHLLIIDPQRSFCQASNPALADAMLASNGNKTTPDIDFIRNGGELFVPGADEDIIRLASMVDRLGDKIDDIHVTLDSHGVVDIAHSSFWISSEGKHPDPFTIITEDDVEKGVWIATLPSCRQRAIEYVKALTVNARYPLCIWPNHCVIGSIGHSVAQPLSNSLNNWCEKRMKRVDYQVKGSNVFTEHYSVFQADVVDPSDPSTMLNTNLINTINSADTILIAGQARSHCVANSVQDLISNLGNEFAKKFVLLEDAMSDVTGFESLGQAFFDDMVKIGMKTSTTVDYLA